MTLAKNVLHGQFVVNCHRTISKILLSIHVYCWFLLIDLGILNKEERSGQRDKKKKHTVWENGE